MLAAPMGDVRDAIKAGAASMSAGLVDLPVVGEWHATEVEARRSASRSPPRKGDHLEGVD
jgi:hypothetical protein